MKKTSLSIYPYSYECEPILRHINLLDKQFELVALFSPAGWGYVGKHYYIDKRHLLVEPIPQESNIEFNSMFIPPFRTNSFVEKLVVNRIIDVTERLDFIINAASFSSEAANTIKCACEKSHCKWQDLTNTFTKNHYKIQTNNKLMNRINNIPIVAIVGEWENTNKFEVSLGLRECLLHDGYRITQIGSRNYCELFGFHSFPFELFRDYHSLENVVYEFRRYIDILLEKECSDLVLITLPGAISAIDEKWDGRFGILPFIASKAINVDYLIMCLFCQVYEKKQLLQLSQLCEYRLDKGIDAIHMSDSYFDYLLSEEKDHPIIGQMNRDERQNVLNYCSTQSSSIFDGIERIQDIYDDLILHLS